MQIDLFDKYLFLWWVYLLILISQHCSFQCLPLRFHFIGIEIINSKFFIDACCVGMRMSKRKKKKKTYPQCLANYDFLPLTSPIRRLLVRTIGDCCWRSLKANIMKKLLVFSFSLLCFSLARFVGGTRCRIGRYRLHWLTRHLKVYNFVVVLVLTLSHLLKIWE